MSKQAVLLLDFGGPETLKDVIPFQIELFSDPAILPLPFGKRVLAKLITAVRKKKTLAQYASIGGGSPLPRQSKKFAIDLEEVLTKAGFPIRVYLGMRYTPPLISEVVWEMVRDNIQEAVVVPLFPQFSFSTTGSVFGVLQKAAAKMASDMKLFYIRSWWSEEEFSLAWVEAIYKELEKFERVKPSEVEILFTAHSLPEILVRKNNDPYPQEIENSVEKIMERSGLKNKWSLSYQSKIGPVKWIGPHTAEAVVEKGRNKTRGLLFAPVSFVSDHIETLYEVDKLYIPEALKAGVLECRRTEPIIGSPHLLQGLQKMVLSRLLSLPLSR